MVVRTGTAAAAAVAAVELQVEAMSSFAARLLLSSWYVVLVMALMLQCSVQLQWQARELCSSAVVPLTRLATWDSNACVLVQPYVTGTMYTTRQHAQQHDQASTRARTPLPRQHDRAVAEATTTTTTRGAVSGDVRYRLQWSSSTSVGAHVLHRRLTRFVHIVLSMASPMQAMTPQDVRQRAYHVLAVVREDDMVSAATRQHSSSSSSSSSASDRHTPALYVYEATVVCYRDWPRCDTVMLPPSVMLPHNTTWLTLTLLDVDEELAKATLGSDASHHHSSSGSSNSNGDDAAVRTGVGVAYQRAAYTVATLVLRYTALVYTLLSMVRFVHCCAAAQRHARRASAAAATTITRHALLQHTHSVRGGGGGGVLAAMLYEQRWVLLLQLALVCYLDPLFAAGVFARPATTATATATATTTMSSVSTALSTLYRCAELRVPAYFVATVVCFCFATIAASYSWRTCDDDDDNDDDNNAAVVAPAAAPRTRPPWWVDVLLLLYVLLVAALDTLHHILSARQAQQRHAADWAGVERVCTSTACHRVLYAQQAVLLAGVLLSMCALHRLKSTLGMRPYLTTRPQQLACRLFIFVYTTAWLYVAVQAALVLWRYPQLVHVVYYHPLLQLSPLLVSCVFVHCMTYVYTPTRRTARRAPLRAGDGRWRLCVWPRAWFVWLDTHGGDMYLFRSEYEERRFYAIQAGLLPPCTAAAAVVTTATTRTSPQQAMPLLVPAHALPTSSRDDDNSNNRSDCSDESGNTTTQRVRHVRSHSASMLPLRHGSSSSDDDDDDDEHDALLRPPQRRRPLTRVPSTQYAYSYYTRNNSSSGDGGGDVASEALHTAVSIDSNTTRTTRAATTDTATAIATTPHAQSNVTPCRTDTTAVAVSTDTSPTVQLPRTIATAAARRSTHATSIVCSVAALCTALLDALEDDLVTRPLRAVAQRLIGASSSSAGPPPPLRRTLHTRHTHATAATTSVHTTTAPTRRRYAAHDALHCRAHGQHHTPHGMSPHTTTATARLSTAAAMTSYAFFNLETAVDCANLAYEAYACLRSGNSSSGDDDADDADGGSDRVASPAHADAAVAVTAAMAAHENNSSNNNSGTDGVLQAWLEHTAERLFVRFFARPPALRMRGDNDDGVNDNSVAARRPPLPPLPHQQSPSSPSRAAHVSSPRMPSLSSPRAPRRFMRTEAYGYTRLATYEVRSVQVLVARLDTPAALSSRAQRPRQEMHSNNNSDSSGGGGAAAAAAAAASDAYVDEGKAPRLVIAFRGTCNAMNAKQNVRVRQRTWREVRQAAAAVAPLSTAIAPGVTTTTTTTTAEAAALAATPAVAAVPLSPSLARVHSGYLELWTALKECVLDTVLRALQSEYQPRWQQQQQQQKQQQQHEGDEGQQQQQQQHEQRQPRHGRRCVDDVVWTLRHSRYRDYMTVYVTGHSMGGALAALCAYSVSRLLTALRYPIPDVTVYTFGQPRFCNRAFQQRYNRAVPRTFRVQNEDDVVATMRVCGGCHVGVEVDIDRHGNYVVHPTVMERLFRPTTGRGLAVINHNLASYGNSLDALAAHSPCRARAFRPYVTAREQRDEHAREHHHHDHRAGEAAAHV